MNEQAIINGFAAVTGVLCSATISFVSYLAAKNKNIRFLGFSILGLIVMSWFAVGYIAILVGAVINSAVYFRPMFPFMAALFTWAVVIAWQYQEYQDVAKDVKRSLENIKEAKAVIEKWEVG